MSSAETATPYAPIPRALTREDFTREETYRATRVPMDWATTLIPEAYRSPGFYDVEQERAKEPLG